MSAFRVLCVGWMAVEMRWVRGRGCGLGIVLSRTLFRRVGNGGREK